MLQKVKMKKEEKIKSLLAQLQSDDEEKVQLAFDEIAQTGNQADLVHLFDFLKRNPDSYASSKIYQLLGELKQPESVPFLIEAILHPDNVAIQSQLIGCCWQNGLDYSAYLPFFCQLVIERDFEVAFEAFTVVENMYGKIAPEVEQSTMEKISAALENGNEQKVYLLRGLLEIIPNIPEAQEIYEP